MSLSFGQVVSCNNILALRAFNTFLFNYSIHEKPNFIERMAIKSAQKWMELRARKEFIELKTDIKSASVTLKDCQTGMFTVLYLASQENLTFNSGTELFKLISDTELEFEKIKNPKEEASYAIQSDATGTDK